MLDVSSKIVAVVIFLNTESFVYRALLCLASYLWTVNSKLFPALTITSCASLCLKLYMSVVLTLITASPALRPAASAGEPLLTCNQSRLTHIYAEKNLDEQTAIVTLFLITIIMHTLAKSV